MNPQSDRMDLVGLGRYVRERRQTLRLTQLELAVRVSWTQERISVLEQGKYGMPSVPALARLASALECSLIELLEAAGVDCGHPGSPPN